MLNQSHVRSSTLEVIGNTPLVKLHKVVPPNSADVLVKLEYFNPTGSYKDRMALAMIEEAEKRGDLRKGTTVVEYTGGSTGSSLAFVCAVKGHPFKVVSSDAFAPEKRRTMRAFGADLTLVPSDGGKITPDLIPRMMDEAKRIAAQDNTYATNQFYNKDSVKGYATIGREQRVLSPSNPRPRRCSRRARRDPSRGRYWRWHRAAFARQEHLRRGTRD